MVTFNLKALQMFARGNPYKTGFIDCVVCAATLVTAVGIDAGAFISNDAEEMAFYALVAAVVPMRFCGSSFVNDVRETLSAEQAETMRVLCERLALPYDLYVTQNYIVPRREFERWVYRPSAMGWDGALSFNPASNRVRFWAKCCSHFIVGQRSWESIRAAQQAHGAVPPPAAFADGATEYEYAYDADARTITLRGTATIDDVVLALEGDDLLMQCGGITVLFKNRTIPRDELPAPAVLVPLIVGNLEEMSLDASATSSTTTTTTTTTL